MPIIIQKPIEASIEYNKLGIDKIDDIERQFTDVHDAAIGYYGSKAKGEDLEQVFIPGKYPRWSLRDEALWNRGSIEKSIIFPVGASFDAKFKIAGGEKWGNFGLTNNVISSTTNATANYYQVINLVNDKELEIKNSGKWNGLNYRENISLSKTPIGASLRYNTMSGSLFAGYDNIGQFFSKADYPSSIAGGNPIPSFVDNLFSSPLHFYNDGAGSGTKNDHVPPNSETIRKPLGVTNIFEYFNPGQLSLIGGLDVNLINKKSSAIGVNSSQVEYFTSLGATSLYQFNVATKQWSEAFAADAGNFSDAFLGAYQNNTFVNIRQELVNKTAFQGLQPENLVDFRKIIRDRVYNFETEEKKAREEAAKLGSIAVANSSYNTVLSDSPDYSTENIENRVNLGDPGNKSLKNLRNYSVGYKGGAASPNSYDKINASGTYQSVVGKQYSADNGIWNDLVHFRVGIFDYNAGGTFTYLHFRSFLNDITDTYKAEWENVKYVGRGEKFYTYSGFSREVSLSFTVAAQSRIELLPMYRRLNYLASACAPDYSTPGYMRGNIIKLTIGGYFHEQPGILTGLSLKMNDDKATWEIDINPKGSGAKDVVEVPHLIEVSGFNFIPIHNFVPQRYKGSEKYISLTDGSTNGYA